MSSVIIQRWALTLSNHQYSSAYKPCHSISHDDGLRRLPDAVAESDVRMQMPTLAAVPDLVYPLPEPSVKVVPLRTSTRFAKPSNRLDLLTGLSQALNNRLTPCAA